jgi:hypothetical protein
MRKCKFSGQPTVFVSMTCTSDCWNENSLGSIVTENNVMNPKEFKVYVRSQDAVSLRQAKNSKWTMQWCAFGESSMKPINYQVCCGSSSPGSWVQYGAAGLYSDINTKGCEFKNVPYYFSSITDTACGKELLGSARCTAKAIGSEAHYSSSKDGFRTYVKNIAGEPYLNQATARSNGWQLNWCGVAASPPTTEGSAGYPCTSPRLLKGNNDNGVFSNEGAICCDKTSAGDWKAAGTRAISKEVDISACGFTKIAYTLVNVRGDNPLQMVSGGSSWAPTDDKTKIKVYLQTNGKYKFYNAEQYHWKVEYCVFGR